jgi:pimeloyl-ACP methyl ester carboxylesterase
VATDPTYGQARCGDGVIDKLLGGAFDAVSERWGVASPRELLPLGVRQRLVVGIDDFIMPERARDAYVAAARASGDEADLIVIPDAGHFEVAPSTAAWPRVRNGILDLLRK